MTRTEGSHQCAPWRHCPRGLAVRGSQRRRKRPALVVQCDRNNHRLDDVIVAMITSVVHRSAIEPMQLLVDITTPEGKQSGLLHTSAVKCEHLITLHHRFLGRVIGRLPPSAMDRIGVC